MSGALTAAAAGEANRAAPTGAEERRFTITGTGTAKVRGNEELAWNFNAIPDRAADHRARQGAGSAGPRHAAAQSTRWRTTTAWWTRRRRSRANLPRCRLIAHRIRCTGRRITNLVLPQARTRNGVGQTTKDLTEHPWAGVEVALTLIARDEGGNEGASSPQDMRLPERLFIKPLARADRAAPHPGARCRCQAAGADRARCAHHRAGTLHAGDRRSISACARSSGSSPMPGPTTRCARWSPGCGRWRSISRTATCRTPSRPCAPPRRRCARRSSAAPPTKNSRS